MWNWTAFIVGLPLCGFLVCNMPIEPSVEMTRGAYSIALLSLVVGSVAARKLPHI